MALKQNVAATWKDIVVWQNVLGTWKKITLKQNVAGVWKQITTLVSATLPASISGNQTKISPLDAVVTLTVSAAGTWTCTGGGSGTWMDGGTGADYDVRMTTSTGTLSSGDAAGTWWNLVSDRTFTRNCTTNGNASNTYTGTLEIRMAASPFTVLDSCTVDLIATVEI